MEDNLKINFGNVKKSFKKNFSFFFTPVGKSILIGLFLLVIIIFSSTMRLQNLPLLIDQTTGEYIPTALDPFYFLRLANTIIENGHLPSYDSMRYPAIQVGFTSEILPQTIVLIYKILHTFDSSVTIGYVDVIYPVIFYALGLIVFFFLIYLLTNSKLTALISSLFLSIIPTYVYRTTAGFADHEPIGMFAFFIALMVFALSIKYIEKPENRKKKNYASALLGLGAGLFSSLTIASWGGIATYLFILIPFSFFLIWMIKSKSSQRNYNVLLPYFIFYILWAVSSIIFGLMYGFSFSSLVTKTLISSSALINPFVVLFTGINLVLIYLGNKNKIKIKNHFHEFLYTLGISLIIGLLFIILSGKIDSIVDIFTRIFNPFGGGRTSLTVSENKQPYLTDWMGQTGKILFWLFFSGLILLGKKISESIKSGKTHKFLFIFLWILMISGIIFSRVSASSLFNGTNFISQLFYIGSVFVFSIYAIYLYFNGKFEINSSHIIIFSWMILSLVSVRGAVRLFFVMSPFVSFSTAFLIVNLPKYFHKTKDDLFKMILGMTIIAVMVLSIISISGLISSVNAQTSATAPSATAQWQLAMKWVRENTPVGSIFVHWWDYGYWVEYLGERPSITDGGHAIGYWDHLIGRYVLTTPNPETALSYMKTNDVSYLLIDQTDLGKYGAYSTIGSNEKGDDRSAFIPVMVSDSSQTQQTETGKIVVYTGGYYIDEDIDYYSNENEIYLPSGKAAMIGITLETVGNETSTPLLNQPRGVYYYNGKQVTIPIRYVYYGKNLIDFGGGLNGTVKIIPSMTFNSNYQVNLDPFGSAIYLSPKTQNGLFAQIYLLDDVNNKYPELDLVHSENDPLVNTLIAQGMDPSENMIYYGGFRGPIKIWKVNYPSNIIKNDEFLRTSGNYAEFDNLTFSK